MGKVRQHIKLTIKVNRDAKNTVQLTFAIPILWWFPFFRHKTSAQVLLQPFNFYTVGKLVIPACRPSYTSFSLFIFKSNEFHFNYQHPQEWHFRMNL